MRIKYIAIQISPFELLIFFIHYDGGPRIQKQIYIYLYYFTEISPLNMWLKPQKNIRIKIINNINHGNNNFSKIIFITNNTK